MKKRSTVSPIHRRKNVSGSPLSGEPVFLVIGKLRRAHGVSGEILMDVLTDFPERIHSGVDVFLGENHTATRLISIRRKDQQMLVKLAGVETPEQVAPFRNILVYQRSDTLPDLPDGSYYHHQLLGVNVSDESGKSLGVLAEILSTGANDVYVVRAEDGKELLFPAIESVILEINLERKEMIVRPQIWE